MENLQRRVSAIYFVRLTVPTRLREVVLRGVTEEHLGIFYRFAGIKGYLLPFDDLMPDDRELGTLVVSNPDQMPTSASAFVANGVLEVPKSSVVAVAASLLVTGEAVMAMFAAVLEPERVESARASQKAAQGATTVSAGKNSHRLFWAGEMPM